MFTYNQNNELQGSIFNKKKRYRTESLKTPLKDNDNV